jgi:hypothetical protein
MEKGSGQDGGAFLFHYAMKLFRTICFAFLGAFALTACTPVEETIAPAGWEGYEHPQKQDCEMNRGGVVRDIVRVHVSSEQSFDTWTPERVDGCITSDMEPNKGMKYCGPVWLVTKTGMFYCDLSERD